MDTGWHTAHGPDIAPGTSYAERTDYADVILSQRLRNALASLNPSLPADALDDAFRKLTHPQGTTLEARNRAFHRMAVYGVTVEYRDAIGAVRGDQARVMDFDDPASNDWLVPSTSSPLWRTATNAVRTWCCSSTACRWWSWS